MLSIFKQAKGIVENIETYLNDIENAVSIFELALKEYFGKKFDRFEERVAEIRKLESECDQLRGKIKFTLYSDLLIPDARGDVLGLIETLDNVVDMTETVSVQFSIEKPAIKDFLIEDFVELTEATTKTANEIILAARAFFRNPTSVNDHLTKVHFWESEADTIEERLKRKAFGSEEIKHFSKKVQMRYFAEKISLLADEAEAVAERLEVYAIKRTF
ncbi:MAG: DUF47 family protein [Spirochaetales bacterium]|nr:DUF47 family protein [Spirochaetales bacterium]